MFEVVLAADPGAPGSAQVASLIRYAAFYGLAACTIALVAAVASWGFSARSGHVSGEAASKKAAVYALAGAVLIGASTGLISFAVKLGQGIK